ncbi:mariner Mos1 transposase [Elysia marginata]|uniref:Mariner Mos1 transposase n=1 Tax=Elysia marginata TaxID=1093978 RepID=A0AAV4J750_9GAST|nr:mariner Mos1 transposase [Elysia marginata]
MGLSQPDMSRSVCDESCRGDKYYKKVPQDKLRPAIRKKRPGLLASGILFHHDNAPVHRARAVTDVLAGYKWELLARAGASSLFT